jgi:hypothetical protein
MLAWSLLSGMEVSFLLQSLAIYRYYSFAFLNSVNVGRSDDAKMAIDWP